MGEMVKVGVFDSGLGGLTVATEIFNQLPWVSLVYYGDTANVPYGEKTPQQLKSFGDQICDFFIKEKVVGILAACNTSSSVSLAFLQEKYNTIPVIGVVKPGVQLALATTKNQKVGVIATEATVRSRAHQQVAAEIDSNVHIFSQSCPKFVPLVESGMVNTIEAEIAAQEYLEPLLEKGIDTLILGCTHYPFLGQVINHVSKHKLQLVNPAYTTVNILASLLAAKGYSNADKVEHRFYVSGDPQSFKEVGQRLIGERHLPVVQKKTLGV